MAIEQSNTVVDDIALGDDLEGNKPVVIGPDELEEERKARQKEEAARIQAENKAKRLQDEITKLKKEKDKDLNEQQLLENRQKELEERDRELKKRENWATAREALSPLRLSDGEFPDESLSLFICDETELTANRCEAIVKLIKAKTLAAAKMERDRIAKEDEEKMRLVKKPPEGNMEPEEKDLFAETFRKEGAKHNLWK